MATAWACRPPQQDHSALHCSRWGLADEAPTTRCLVSSHFVSAQQNAQQQQRLCRLRLGGSGRQRHLPAAAAAGQTPAAPPEQQQQQQWQQADDLPGQPDAALQVAARQQAWVSAGGATAKHPPTLDLSLARDDADVVDYLYRQYGLYERRQVRGKAARALAALQSAEPSTQALSVRRDILPKLELLEALSPGLGWRVFRRFPEEFASPEAVERWRLAAAYLFTLGIQPDEISVLFSRHAVLFRAAVARPDNLRGLFDWLSVELGLPAAALLKLVNRCPSVLQADVETVLRPRLRFLTHELGLPQERAVTGVLRCPEVLGVDTVLLSAKAAFLTGDLGMSRQEVGAMYVKDPTVLLASLARLRETSAWLREELGLSEGLLRKVVAKGGALKYPLPTLQERVAYWRHHLGFSADELRQLLDASPRLLLYPMHEPKYQAKLAFLREELGLPLRALLAYPSYISYSLPARIAPRAAAARALAARPLPLSKLAVKGEAFARWLGVSPEEWAAWEAAWQAGPEAQRWEAAGAAAALPATGKEAHELDATNAVAKEGRPAGPDET